MELPGLAQCSACDGLVHGDHLATTDCLTEGRYCTWCMHLHLTNCWTCTAEATDTQDVA